MMGQGEAGFKKRKSRKWLLILCIAVIILVSVFICYVNMDYPASEEARQLLSETTDITYDKKHGEYVIAPREIPKAGIIFYPGAKVEEMAYLPMLEMLSREGYFCIDVHMPFQMAVFDVNAAESIMERYPEISRWYLMGHSLGGAMAASFAGSNSSQVEGLILLGAYSAADISETDLKVLSVYGSQDKVLNKEKYEEYRKYLPEDYEEVVITGGNHAQFGNYGKQKGDGEAAVSRLDQQKQVCEAVNDFLLKD